MYRYWTGTEWTAAITASPATTPPPAGPVGIPPDPQPKRSNVGWWIGGIGVLVALGLVIWLVTQGVGRFIPGSGSDPVPGGNPSQDVCPKVDESETPTPPPQRNDGRVHGGRISYPQLDYPWGEVSSDPRVPFGRDVAEQVVLVEDNYDGQGHSWVASVLVAELVAGDGFFNPQEGAEIVMRCVVGVFYSDAPVDRDDQVSKAVTIDGHDAWLLESHLSFDIEGLQTKGELAIIAIVDTGAESASLFYASIPDTTPEFVTDARSAMENLKVDA